jgi:nitroreductase
MMLKKLITSNRSYRRFSENIPVEEGTLRELVDLARLSASAGNLQPLKFFLSCTPEQNAKIFPCLKWARALKDWSGPAEGERPSAYIIILGDKRIVQSFASYDTGIAAQSILLGAVEKGLGGCMIASCNRTVLMEELKLDDEMEIQLVIALGEPSEKVVIDPLREDGSTDYFRDAQDVHHVPKRSLDEIIIN